MLNVRPDADSPNQPQPGSGPDARTEPANRLNLLLSYAGWQHESWVDRLPRLLEPMGILSLRAGTGREASRVIDEHPIHIAVVDLSLPPHPTPPPPPPPAAGPTPPPPRGRPPPPPPTVVIKRARSHRDDCREINAALRCGAFAVIDRPHTQSDLERLLEVLRRCLTRYYQGRWPGGLA